MQVNLSPSTYIDPALVQSLQSELHEWGKDALSDAPVEQNLALAIAMEQEASAIRRKCAEEANR